MAKSFLKNLIYISSWHHYSAIKVFPWLSINLFFLPVKLSILLSMKQLDLNSLNSLKGIFQYLELVKTNARSGGMK